MSDLLSVTVGKIQIICSLVLGVSRRFQPTAGTDGARSCLPIVEVAYRCVIGEDFLVDPALQVPIECRRLVLRIRNAGQRSATAPAKLRCPVLRIGD